MSHEYWFKPKTFGYGATPTTWEGWALVAVYILVLVAGIVAMTLRKESFATYIASLAVIGVATVVMVVVSVQKTDGAWHWSWGAKKIAGKSE